MIFDPRLWAGACVALVIVAVIVFPERLFGPPPVPETRSTPRSEPVVTRIAGEKHAFEVDALRAFGATPWAETCPPGVAPPEGDARRMLACGVARSDGGSLAAAAGFRLMEAMSLSGEERETAVRDANGAVLEDLNQPERPKSNDWQGLAEAYATLAEKPADPRLYDIAAEIALVDAALCDSKAEAACASNALKDVGERLVEAGHRANSLERLGRAANLLRQAVDALPQDYDAEERASLIEELGSAYAYAAHFEEEGRKLEWLELAVQTGERNLAYADAKAPSFTSARIWANLGSSYNSRGGEQTSSDDFRRSIAYYDKALAFFKREEDPVQWAEATENYAAARSSIASVERDLGLHDRAVADFEASAAVFDGKADKAFDAAFVRYRLAQAFGARAITALQMKNRRKPNDPAPDRLDDIVRDSIARGLAATDAAAPALKAAGSNVYLARLEAERTSLLARRTALLGETKPQ